MPFMIFFFFLCLCMSKDLGVQSDVRTVLVTELVTIGAFGWLPVQQTKSLSHVSYIQLILISH